MLQNCCFGEQIIFLRVVKVKNLSKHYILVRYFIFKILIKYIFPSPIFLHILILKDFTVYFSQCLNIFFYIFIIS